MNTKPALAVTDAEWLIVQGVLARHVPECEVWAFGSRARGTPKTYSDLDLAVLGGGPLSVDTSSAMAEDFAESDLPWKVDVVDWALTSPAFRHVIERDRVVVQSAGRSP